MYEPKNSRVYGTVALDHSFCSEKEKPDVSSSVADIGKCDI
jgi:hypothetical protein